MSSSRNRGIRDISYSDGIMRFNFQISSAAGLAYSPCAGGSHLWRIAVEPLKRKLEFKNRHGEYGRLEALPLKLVIKECPLSI
jgi:hypothetical protein